MNKHVLSRKLFVPILTLFSLTLITISSPTAFAIDFEIGTQFGISRLSSTDSDDETTLTYSDIPSGSILNVGTTSTTLYAMFYPHKAIGIGPEFSYGSMSVTDELWGEKETSTISTLHLGGRVAFYLTDYAFSSPYLLGHASLKQFSGDVEDFPSFTESIRSIGIGVGYQLVIKPAFVLRFEGKYSRLAPADADDPLNEFALTIGIGTRFGN